MPRHNCVRIGFVLRPARRRSVSRYRMDAMILG